MMLSILATLAVFPSTARRAASVALGHPLDKAVIYEANLRATGDMKGLKSVEQRLPAIKKLGANIVWLMPVQPAGKLNAVGGLGSPYAIANYGEVGAEYGSESDLHSLVDTAHRLGLKVIIDWVANHTAWDNPWIQQHPDWYKRDAKGEITHPPGTSWLDVAALNYANPELRRAMEDEMERWVELFHIDGFRCDAADYVPIAFWSEAIAHLRKRSKWPLLMLGEGGNPKLYDAGFDVLYGWNVYDRLAAIFSGSPASTLNGALKKEASETPAGKRRLRFITNHDQTAFQGSLDSRFGSQPAAETAFFIAALSGGIPLIYSGQEASTALTTPIFDQSSIDYSQNPKLALSISDVLKERAKVSPLLDGTPVDHSSRDAVVLAFADQNSEAVIIANVRPTSTSVSGLPAGKWRNVQTNEVIELPSELELKPYQRVLLTRAMIKRT